ncbi:SGNH/GDSL hydrolase family protein [Kitasatospora sp. NPDC056446]|uniref:SGNH/GDSL hydrolase family protein n=1 Tax=Kitasatospora sp. NPDC056446 TaxID=3345819 RepID=UPI0036A0F24F
MMRTRNRSSSGRPRQCQRQRPGPRRRPWAGLALALALLVPTAGPSLAGPSLAGPVQPPREAAPPAAAAAAAAAPSDPAGVPRADRDRLLPADWRTSDDRAWTTVGDGDGFHVLVADSASGYTWRTAATLSEPAFDADQWIGNACLTASGRRLVVVYAPRTFTSTEQLFRRGGFTAVVDLVDGTVTKLGVQTSLAYFNPGCGVGERAVLTQSGDDGQARTRLTELDAADGRLAPALEVSGEVTSAVPAKDGIVAADGARLVRIGPDGGSTPIADSTGAPFRVQADADGAVFFLDRAGDTLRARRTDGTGTRSFATGRVGELRLTSGAGGRVFLTGASPGVDGPLPRGVTRFAAPVDAVVSSTGRLAVSVDSTPSVGRVEAATPGAAGAAGAAGTPGAAPEPGSPEPVRLKAVVRDKGTGLGFRVAPEASAGAPGEAGRALSPALLHGARTTTTAADARTAPTGAEAGAAGAAPAVAAVDSPYDPVDASRTCEVPRNDVRTQVYQPTSRQVEYAADLAVQHKLPAWQDPGRFPPVPLVGGGEVPAALLLGLMSQESNLWQASRLVPEGSAGNPIIGNYYGLALYDDNPLNDWDVRWDKADCGYGVGQVTDGMRRTDTSRTPELKRAIAVDFRANVAASLRILQQKWNEVHAAGMKANNDDPARPENWFFATWAYNSGFHGRQPGDDTWGLGWLNNPVNPQYPADRQPFLEMTMEDARHPQHWPYPEKVLGFAARSIPKEEGRDGAGFRPAWWPSVEDRRLSKPPVEQFCGDGNACYPGRWFVPDAAEVQGEPVGPCGHKNSVGRYDLKCWYHESSTWRPRCDLECGHDTISYDSVSDDPGNGTRHPAACDRGLPADAMVIDDLPDDVASPTCGSRTATQGSFRFDFGSENGLYPAKVDLHQIGMGRGGHFWMAHTWTASERFRVTGTWTLGRPLNGWARVMVHMPDIGAHTQRAWYTVNRGAATPKTRSLLQRTEANQWVSLGAFRFDGVPSVSLGNQTDEAMSGDQQGVEDIAWDAVAFQPLPDKPADQIVALGDSYSSGEGASAADQSGYFRETNNNGDNWHRNACHRSRYAWSRQGTLPDAPAWPIGDRADGFADPAMDYHLLACSGAVSENLLPHDGEGNEPPPTNAWGRRGTGQFREPSQLDRGFLDENTTLVTLSLGGNDARFTPIVRQCVLVWGGTSCPDSRLDGDSEPLRVAEPRIITDKVRPSVERVLSEIHRKAPRARILLMGYPRLFSDPSCLKVPMSGSDATWLNGIGDLLDEQLRAAADTVSRNQLATVVFADPRSAFQGKGVCGDPEGIHGLVGQRTDGDEPPALAPSQQSFHPNPTGVRLYAGVFNDAVRK